MRPHPYYAPQLDIDRWLTGTVPTIWLQDRLWDGHLSWWEASLSVLTKLHFIVPPTLLFLIWLRRRELYYRFAATLVAVSFAGALTFAIWPAAPPWMAGRDGWIPRVHRIGYSQVTGVPESTSSWIHQLYDIRNEAAAVPSLHAAYALLVVLFCFALGRRVGICAIPYARRHVVHHRLLRRALRVRRADRVRLRRDRVRAGRTLVASLAACGTVRAAAGGRTTRPRTLTMHCKRV